MFFDRKTLTFFSEISAFNVNNLFSNSYLFLISFCISLNESTNLRKDNILLTRQICKKLSGKTFSILVYVQVFKLDVKFFAPEFFN